MSKYEYTEEERALNAVLKHQRSSLDSIEHLDMASLDAAICSSEKLLAELGVDPAECVEDTSLMCQRRGSITLPTWEELSAEALEECGQDIELEDLFTQEELERNEQAIIAMNEDYLAIHRLDKFDVAISASAAICAAAIDMLLIGIPARTPDGLKAAPLSDYIRDKFEKKYPPGMLENSSSTKVPYDAQDNRATTEHVEGLSAYYHRLLSLGHDPLLGLVVGVMDILSGKMTTIDKSGKVVRQAIEAYASRRESDIFAAIAKQIAHYKSDVTTSMGLPAPMMGLFNLLQLGSVGEEEQTIAEIVQGMYYEGYDFIHFCGQSIPVMLVEVIVRIGYAIKRIKEGVAVKDAIPFSCDREKNPKLTTMLFIAHTGATAVNAGKVVFTENPMAINYPQWTAFAKYVYSQAKWVLLDKPAACDAYISGKLEEEMNDLYGSINKTLIDVAGNNAILL